MPISARRHLENLRIGDPDKLNDLCEQVDERIKCSYTPVVTVEFLSFPPNDAHYRDVLTLVYEHLGWACSWEPTRRPGYQLLTLTPLPEDDDD